MAVVTPKEFGGYNCNFVEPVPSSLTCPVCLLPFRDPHLLDCCGAKYCASCIGRVKTTGHRQCPICKQPFNSIVEKNDQRRVLGLKVHCSNEGCKWIGELRHLDNHEKERCEWVLMECRYKCGINVPRTKLSNHEQQCPERLQSFLRDAEKRYEKEVVSMRERLEETLGKEEAKLKKEMAVVRDKLIKFTEEGDVRESMRELLREDQKRQRKELLAVMHLREDQICRTLVANIQTSIKAVHEQRQKLRSDLEKMHKDHVSQVKQLLAEHSRSRKNNEIEAFLKEERKRQQNELDAALADHRRQIEEMIEKKKKGMQEHSTACAHTCAN